MKRKKMTLAELKKATAKKYSFSEVKKALKKESELGPLTDLCVDISVKTFPRLKKVLWIVSFSFLGATKGEKGKFVVDRVKIGVSYYPDTLKGAKQAMKLYCAIKKISSKYHTGYYPGASYPELNASEESRTVIINKK